MTCSEGRVDGSFAFSILSELLMATIFIFSILYLLGKFPRSIYGPTVCISSIVFLLFSIIQFSALGGTCIDDLTSELGRRGTRQVHAFITAIRNILIFFFLLPVILYNVFVAQGDILLRDSVPAAKQDPQLSTTTGTTYMSPPTNLSTTTGQQHTILSPMQPTIAQPPMPAQQPAVPVQQPPMAPIQPAPVMPATQQMQ